MNWWVGGSFLVTSGVVLRHLLGLGKSTDSRGPGLIPLDPEREAVYRLISQDMQTQCTILGITLNDAFEERNSGRTETAVRLIQLCGGEWERVNGIMRGLLKAIASHMGDAHVAVPLRDVCAHRFKSRTMTDFFRMYEFLDQLVFRSRLRFQLQLRMLRRAAERLTGDFRRSCRYLARTGDPLPELWSRLDLFYHDLDLLSKESLLAFRVFLVCLPDSALPAFASELESIRVRVERAIPV